MPDSRLQGLIVILKCDRLIGQVGAGHDQRRKGVCRASEQVMNRRVGQHQAEQVITGGNQRRDRAVLSPCGQ